MPDASADVVVQLVLDRQNRWFIVPVSVGPDYLLEMLPNPTSARSLISARAREQLVSRGLLSPDTSSLHCLRDLKIQGQDVPDLMVRVARLAPLRELDGILGQDFFEQYREVRYDPRARRLTLLKAESGS